MENRANRFPRRAMPPSRTSVLDNPPDEERDEHGEAHQHRAEPAERDEPPFRVRVSVAGHRQREAPEEQDERHHAQLASHGFPLPTPGRDPFPPGCGRPLPPPPTAFGTATPRRAPASRPHHPGRAGPPPARPPPSPSAPGSPRHMPPTGRSTAEAP